VGRDEWRAFIAAYLGWALDAMDAMLYSLVIVAIMREFSLNTAQAGFLASLTFLAAGAGAWLWGILADRIGRTKAMIFGILFYATGTLLCGLAPNVLWLGVFRVIVGLGVGGEWGTGAALLAETWPASLRAKALAFMQSGFAVGYALGALVTALVMPHFGWRGVFFVGFVPALITLWIRTAVKEPELWQRMQRQERETLTGKVGLTGGLTRSVAGGSFGELWTRPFIRTTIGLFLYGFLSLFAYYAVFTWLPGYMATPVEKGGPGLSIVKSATWMMVIQMGALVGYITYGYLADWIGRRWSSVFYLIIGAIMVPLFVTIREPSLLLVAGPILALGGHGYVAGFGTIAGELYPTRMRATAQGFLYGSGRWASGVAPWVVGWLALKYKLGGAMLIASGGWLLAAICLLIFIRETKGTVLTE